MNIKPLLFTHQTYSTPYLNILYNFYKGAWESAFDELKVHSTRLNDDFFRLPLKLGIFNDLEPMAFHGYQLFDLEQKAHQEHHYFKQLDFALPELLLSHGIKKIATMEYFAVDPKYRKGPAKNLNITKSVVGLACQLLSQLGIDRIITITRNNRKVNELCFEFGGESLFSNLTLNNTSVDIITFEPCKILRHPNIAVRNQVDKWLLEINSKQKNILKNIA